MKVKIQKSSAFIGILLIGTGLLYAVHILLKQIGSLASNLALIGSFVSAILLISVIVIVILEQ